MIGQELTCGDNGKLTITAYSAFTLAECNQACNGASSCFTFTFGKTNGACVLKKLGCHGAYEADSELYIASDVVMPTKRLNVCTHRFGAGRSSSKISKCSGYRYKVDCENDDDCSYN